MKEGFVNSLGNSNATEGNVDGRSAGIKRRRRGFSSQLGGALGKGEL
jgi:hypothetical protein